MKIKLKDVKNPMVSPYCFNKAGFCQTTFDKVNSGEETQVERVPASAWDYVEEVKETKKQTKKKGDK
tara:strand:- start:496 stop:696 length:201 start_codon:yes stop_codon:yes gene_type:complete